MNNIKIEVNTLYLLKLTINKQRNNNYNIVWPLQSCLTLNVSMIGLGIYLYILPGDWSVAVRAVLIHLPMSMHV